MLTSRHKTKPTIKKPLKIIFCHVDLHLWFFYRLIWSMKIKKIMSLYICYIATVQLFHSSVSWEQNKMPVYLKNVVKAKHSQFFICVWLSTRGSLSAITWKVRAQSDLRMSRNKSLCCCRGSGGHSWSPARAEEGDQGGSTGLGPGSVLRDHTFLLSAHHPVFFSVGCLWWKKSETPKTS